MRKFSAFIVTVSLSAMLLAACAKAPAAASTATIKVDESGFVPSEVTATAGQPLTLRVTRTTDRTCAKEIVIKDQGIRQDLPLNQMVEVQFTPKAKGDVRFACAMDMIAGTIHVQ